MGETTNLRVPAPLALAGLIGSAPPVGTTELKDATSLTRPWQHGALHDPLGPMEGHVIITYYGEPQDILWQTGGERLQSTTRSGSITIIPQGHDGVWDIAGPIGVSHVFLSDQRLRSSAERLGCQVGLELLPRVGFDDPVASRVMEMLGRESHVAAPSSRLFVEQATDLLVTQLLRAHVDGLAFEGHQVRRGLAQWQVRKVTGYMRDRLGAPIGLDDLAAVAGLSRFHFCTAFRQATGTTPHEWLVRLRIEKARQLLADPTFSITDIGLAVGYETPSSFSAAFRRVVGATPTAFRRAL
ncbi:AraC family transcriptional regulator [Stenotrophomonas maltophilia]|uniref:AraC family transcriptional regulator n=1 Tax=Stenotrophomonas maltophilia TaxID=40324 RepID=UPI0012AF7555|nr:AraC family transcriptional regulator [Stenotrophomonas maltophilia]QGM05623.1 helix-turn-helix transcriptional regulator [Stenotrophomonas maltophilia]